MRVRAPTFSRQPLLGSSAGRVSEEEAAFEAAVRAGRQAGAAAAAAGALPRDIAVAAAKVAWCAVWSQRTGVVLNRDRAVCVWLCLCCSGDGEVLRCHVCRL